MFCSKIKFPTNRWPRPTTGPKKEDDLAKLAALTDQDRLEHDLRLFNAGGGSWSYEPVRASTSDILDAKTPLLGDLPTVSWGQIAKQIRAASNRGQIQAAANMLVGKVLFEEARTAKWKAVKFPIGRMPIGRGETVA